MRFKLRTIFVATFAAACFLWFFSHLGFSVNYERRYSPTLKLVWNETDLLWAVYHRGHAIQYRVLDGDFHRLPKGQVSR